MSQTHAQPTGNYLLRMLPTEEYERLLPKLARVDLALGSSIFEPNVPMNAVYFPVDSIISLLCIMEDGGSAEIAVVGNEAVVGMSLFMGGDRTPSRAVVQSAGTAYRLTGHRAQAEFNRGGALQQMLLRYMQALLAQMGQTAVCNRHHTVDQQLCRWLLLSHDRLPGHELVMTQELIANMLGVRREGVTFAAGRLQREGLIEYHRGQIAILDRAGLMARSCECYGVVKKEYDRLLPLAAAT